MRLLSSNVFDIARDENGQSVGYAQRYIFLNGTDHLARLYSDPNLTCPVANPMRADAQGRFDLCYVAAATYRVEIYAPSGDTLAQIPGVTVTAYQDDRMIRSFHSVAAMMDDTVLSYDAMRGHLQVGAGLMVQISDGGHTYVIAEKGATDADLMTAGGIKLYVRACATGLNVRAFGARGDDIHDDGPALQAAINSASRTHNSVYVPPGTYFCNRSLLFFYDKVRNQDFFYPNTWNKDLLGGRVMFTGAGRLGRRDFQTRSHTGSVIRFGPGSSAIFSDKEVGRRASTKTVANLSFIGESPTIIRDTVSGSFTVYDNVFVGTSGAAPDKPIMHISDNYMSRYQNIEIVGDQSLGSARVGWGLWVEPSDTAGGANVYQNITASYVDKGIVFGRPYDAQFVGMTCNSRSSICEALQGHYANVGLHVMQGAWNMSFRACWVEHCDIAGIWLNNSCRNISFDACNISRLDATAGERGGIVIGSDTGNGNVDAATNIEIRNCYLVCWKGVAGIFLHDAAREVLVAGSQFRNSGGAAIGVAGQRGGELSLQRNDYQANETGSPISSSRRVCRISGSFEAPTFENMAHTAYELDFAYGTYDGDLDFSNWRRPPREISIKSLTAGRTLILPDLTNASGERAVIRIDKPFAAFNVTIDAQEGQKIGQTRTYTLSNAGSVVELRHAGNGFSRWDILQIVEGSF